VAPDSRRLSDIAYRKVLEGLFEGLAAGCGRYIGVHLRPAAGGRLPMVWTVG